MPKDSGTARTPTRAKQSAPSRFRCRTSRASIESIFARSSDQVSRFEYVGIQESKNPRKGLSISLSSAQNVADTSGEQRMNQKMQGLRERSEWPFQGIQEWVAALILDS